jgi:hypothetical protein
MGNLDNYDSTSERVENATVMERFNKFKKISNLLKENGITIVDVGRHIISLEDKSCGYRLGHGITAWEIFRVVDVVDMIVSMRNDFIKRTKNDS